MLLANNKKPWWDTKITDHEKKNMKTYAYKRDRTVFRVWEACFNPAHAQHLVLFHRIIPVTNLKIISQTEHD